MLSELSPTSATLAGLAYSLILIATIPLLAQYKTLTWALVPTWLVMTGYAASIMKSASTDPKQSKRFGEVVWLTWLTYYALVLVWPLHMHWYEGLVVLALFAYPDKLVTPALLTAYYMLSTATYLEVGDAMQVAGRGILAGVAAVQLWEATKAAKDPQLKSQ